MRRQGVKHFLDSFGYLKGDVVMQLIKGKYDKGTIKNRAIANG